MGPRFYPDPIYIYIPKINICASKLPCLLFEIFYIDAFFVLPINGKVRPNILKERQQAKVEAAKTNEDSDSSSKSHHTQPSTPLGKKNAPQPVCPGTTDKIVYRDVHV